MVEDLTPAFQVHDELVLEVPESELEFAKANVPGLMTNVARLDVPLVAEPGAGRNWEEAHKSIC